MIATVAILALSLGGFGGSFQPTRLLILFSGLFFELRRKSRKNLIGLTPLIRKGLFIYFLWIFYGVFTLLWSPDPSAGLNSEIIVMTIGMSSLLFFPYYYENNSTTIHSLCRAWAWSCILTLPVAVYEILTFQHFFYEDQDRVLGGLGLNVPFAAVFYGGYNGYSTALCFYYPFLLITFLQERRKFFKIFFGIAIVATLVIVLINTSRGAMVVVGVISLCAIRINIKLILKTILGAALVYLVIPSSIKETIDTVIKYRFVDAGGMKDTARSDLLSGGLDFVKESYGFGIGAGGFESAMEKSGYFSGMVNPHNILLEVLSQYGVIIFLFFLYWLYLLGYHIWKSNALDSKTKRILMGTILCIPIIGVIHSAALGYTYWWVFFTSIALIASVKSPKINMYENKFN